MSYNTACQVQIITLNNLRTQVRIGCEREEREVPQFVRFDIQVRLAELPKGCFTDQITDTVCYFETAQRVFEVCRRAEYGLIEKLAWDVFAALKEFLPAPHQLGLRVTKEKPPVPGLEGGASIYLGDWIPL